MSEVNYEGRDLEVLAQMSNYYDWIMETFAPHVTGKTVEYGAGTGNVSERLVPLAGHLTLVEPSVALIGTLRTRFAGTPSVEIADQALEPHVVQAATESEVDGGIAPSASSASATIHSPASATAWFRSAIASTGAHGDIPPVEVD